MTRYIGSGPYCYANCLAMAFADGTDPSLIEVLTGSPFGLQLLGGRTPLFDPLGWDPNIGIDAALELLGWTCERGDGGKAADAISRLRRAVSAGPVIVGPVEMGLLGHQPQAQGATGADHFVLVTDFDAGMVRFHDPDGYPYVTLPAKEFAAAWRGNTIGYAEAEYTMRTAFRRVCDISPLDALRASLPRAVAWLDGQPGQAPPNSVGSGAAALALAGLIEDGLAAGQRDSLVWFAVRVGARRLADAEYWLGQLGLTQAAAIAGTQAKLVGSLQYELVAGDDDVSAAAILRELAPTYAALCRELAAAAPARQSLP
jgi:hypothetical protein